MSVLHRFQYSTRPLFNPLLTDHYPFLLPCFSWHSHAIDSAIYHLLSGRNGKCSECYKEWNDNGCEGGTNCRLFNQEKRVSMAHFMSVHETTEKGWAFFLLLSVFDCIWWWKVNVACVSTTMIHNAYVSIRTLIFYFISNPKQFFLFLIWCYLLHRISYFGCSKHHVQFSLMLHVTIILVCFTLVVPSLCILPLFWLSC